MTVPTTSRIAPRELAREQIDSQTVQARYKAGYGFVVVTSKFTGNKPLGDLFFEIIQKKRELCISGQHDENANAHLR
jgi:hypothetical protein